jgi:Protein of unknown function (DUF3500)
LAALGLVGAVPSLAAAQTATTTATGPWTGGEVPASSRSSRQMAHAARAFLDSLTPDQLALAWYADLSDQTRTRWTNLPTGAVARPGVGLGDLSDTQRVLLHNLLRASTSSQGYHKLTGAIRADGVLGQMGGSSLSSSAFYYTTIFGLPEDGVCRRRRCCI